MNEGSMARKLKEVTAESRKSKKTNGAHEPIPGVSSVEDMSIVQMSFREANGSMEKEVSDFRDYIVTKYSMYHGHNLHSKIAWYLEQMGIGVAFEVEKLNLKKRQERVSK
jgi:hypothetical protein